MLTEPARSAYDLNFNFGGVPVRVHPWFWIITAIMGAQGSNGPLMLIWVAAVFVSVLVHELGHALAIRYYGFHCHVVLYSLGGLAVQDSPGRRTSAMQVLISLAGPAAGFALALVLLVALQVSSAPIRFVPFLISTPWYPYVGPFESRYFTVFVNDMLQVNIFWGLINLLPIFPLDGGQAARAMLTHTNGGEGERQAKIVSIAAAAIVVYLALTHHQPYLALMFGYLGFINYQSLNQWSSGSRW